MARPSKNTVDYFPHICKHGKTLYIIESHFGNDGYAFWFKLLECLGASENHYINCNLVDAWEYLQAKVKLSEDICTKILDKLAKLEAIDPDLWCGKIIYSQNFVDNIADAYKKRNTELVTKIELMEELTQFLPPKTNQNGQVDTVSVDGKPQSKVKKSKVDNSKKEYAPTVTLTEEEYQKLIDRFGLVDAEKRINKLSLWQLSNGKTKDSSYFTILNWANRDGEKSISGYPKKLTSEEIEKIKLGCKRLNIDYTDKTPWAVVWWNERKQLYLDYPETNATYTLHEADTLFRITIGGPGDESKRIC
jgi:hypothetical protein